MSCKFDARLRYLRLSLLRLSLRHSQLRARICDGIAAGNHFLLRHRATIVDVLIKRILVLRDA